MEYLMKKKEKLIIGAVVLLAFAIILGGLTNNLSNANNSYIYENYELFTTVFNTVRAYYYDVKKVKSKKLIYGAIKGLMDSLGDPYSIFMKPPDYKNLYEDTSGEFGGLGIMIGIRDSKLTIITPLYGTPAWKKHLKPGDVIALINGKSTKNISLFDAVKKLRGKIGTKVTISILRHGHDELFEVKIIRGRIKIETVKKKFLKDKIAYIKITQFSKPTARVLKKTLLSFKKKGMKYLIVDLRNNPGGLLSSAIDVTDLFMSKGKIVYTKGRDVSHIRKFMAKRKTTVVDKNVPIIVLVNKGSASASEIFSGAMQDTKRAYILGEKTFGKGSVQTLKTLQDNSAIKLTIALYYTPSGRRIHKKGLTPDYIVKEDKYTKKEQKSIRDLLKGNYLGNFVKKYSKNTDKAIAGFACKMRKKGIYLSNYEFSRWVDWEKNKIGRPKLMNLKYDIQLRKALHLIRNGKLKKISLRTF